MIAARRHSVPYAVVLYRTYHTVLGRWITPFTRASSWTCCSTTYYRADSTPMLLLQLDELLGGCPRMHPFADEMPQLMLPAARRSMRTRAATVARRISTGLVSIHSCLLHHHHHHYHLHHRHHHRHQYHRHQCHLHHRLQRFSTQPCSVVRPIVRFACFRFTAVSQLQRRLAGLSAAVAPIGEMFC